MISGNSGLTIIELMIAATLISIVIAVGYSIYFFGTTSFGSGTAQAHAQQQVRLADDYIKREVRNAFSISVRSEYNEWQDDFDGYIKVDTDGSLVVSGNKVSDSVISNIIVNIASEAGGSYVLTYSITGNEESQNYSLDNQILLNNIINSDGYHQASNDASLNNYVLYYGGTINPNAGDQLPEGYAFIDKNHNRVYNSDTDILVPINDLKDVFVSETYICQDSGRVGGDGSLIVPFSVGIIDFKDWWPNDLLDWKVYGDIILGTDLVFNKNSEGIIHSLNGDIIFGDNKSIGTNNNSGLYKITLKTDKGNLISNGLKITTKSDSNGQIIIEAANSLIINNSIIESAGDKGIRIESDGVVNATKSLIKSTNGTVNAVVNITSSGDINLDNAEIQSSSSANPEPALLVKSLSGSISAQGDGTIIISTNSEKLLEIIAANNINIDSATVTSAGNIFINAGNNLSAQTASISTSHGNCKVEMRINSAGPNNYIDLKNATLDSKNNQSLLYTNNTNNTIDVENTCLKNVGAIAYEATVLNKDKLRCGALSVVNSGSIIWDGPVYGVDYIFNGNNFIEGYGNGNGNQNKSDNQLYLEGLPGDILKGERSYVIKMDLTDISKLRIDWQNTGWTDNMNKSYFIVSNSIGGDSNTDVIKHISNSNTFSRKMDELDVSDLTGDYYIRIHAKNDHISWNRNSKITVFDFIVTGYGPIALEISGSNNLFTVIFDKPVQSSTPPDGATYEVLVDNKKIVSYPKNSGNYANNTDIAFNVTDEEGTSSDIVVKKTGTNWDIKVNGSK
jgi:hypothetical protein